jgi:hypothetical protein
MLWSLLSSLLSTLPSLLITHPTGVLSVPRLVPELSLPAGPQGPYQLLTSSTGGGLDSLVSRALDLEQALAGSTVVVAVRAVGINFRDLLNVLGMYPGDAGNPGSDCSGVVVRSTSGSGHLPGTAVFGLATGCLGTHVVAEARTMVPLPPNVSFEDGAAAPTIQARPPLKLHIWRSPPPSPNPSPLFDTLTLT